MWINEQILRNLIENRLLLNALLEGGVNNWEWYSECYEVYEDSRELVDDVLNTIKNESKEENKNG